MNFKGILVLVGISLISQPVFAKSFRELFMDAEAIQTADDLEALWGLKTLECQSLQAFESTVSGTLPSFSEEVRFLSEGRTTYLMFELKDSNGEVVQYTKCKTTAAAVGEKVGFGRFERINQDIQTYFPTGDNAISLFGAGAAYQVSRNIEIVDRLVFQLQPVMAQEIDLSSLNGEIQNYLHADRACFGNTRCVEVSNLRAKVRFHEGRTSGKIYAKSLHKWPIFNAVAYEGNIETIFDYPIEYRDGQWVLSESEGNEFTVSKKISDIPLPNKGIAQIDMKEIFKLFIAAKLPAPSVLP